MFKLKFLKTYIPLGNRNRWKNLKKIWKRIKKKIGFGKKNFDFDTDNDPHSLDRYFWLIPNFGCLNQEQQIIHNTLLLAPPAFQTFLRPCEMTNMWHGWLTLKWNFSAIFCSHLDFNQPRTICWNSFLIRIWISSYFR